MEVEEEGEEEAWSWALARKGQRRLSFPQGRRVEVEGQEGLSWVGEEEEEEEEAWSWALG